MNLQAEAQKALAELLDGRAVEWQNHEWIETRSGKRKETLKGIPTKGFWNAWKRHKDLLKLSGVTIYAGKAESTGEYRIHKGISYEVKRKAWEVTIWINKANQQTVRRAGFETLVNPESETAREYLAETQGPFNDPF